MTPKKFVFIFLIVLTLLRLIYVGQIGPAPDEAYYFLWSERLDWSYYSKGPGVAYAMALGTGLLGDNEFGLRFLSPLLALGTSLLLFFLARRLFNESVAVWTVVLMNVVPIFQVGALVMTIDPLSIFFWTAGLCCFWLALEKTPRFSAFWILGGLVVGLGFLAKYTNALQLLSIFLILFLSPRHRIQLLRPGPWLALLVFALCTLPVIIWNRENDWITFTHLLETGQLESGVSFRPLELLEFFGIHFGVYSPLIFVGMLMALVHAVRRFRTSFAFAYLLAFALPILLLYTVVSLQTAGEGNWTAPAFLSIGLLTAAYWVPKASAGAGAAKYAVVALWVGLAMSLLIINTDTLRALGLPWAYNRDPSGRLRGWESAAVEVERLRKAVEEEWGEELFLVSNSWQNAATLAFHFDDKRQEGPRHPPIYFRESPLMENQFSFWPRYDGYIESEEPPPGAPVLREQTAWNPFIGRNALFITSSDGQRPAFQIRESFVDWIPLADVKVKRRGLPVRRLRIFVCYDYQGLPL